jgi:hypothetical protein
MRSLLLAIVLASVAVVSCSDPDPAPPKAFINAQMGPGNDPGVNGSAECKLNTQSWLVLGTSDSSAENGTKQSEANIGISCSVVPEGDGFRVAASATLSPGGTVSVTGLFRSGGAQQGITGSFVRADTGTFRQTDCTVEYKNQNMGVAPGMVWGYITCPNAAFVGGQDRTCLAQGEFRFENCNK